MTFEINEIPESFWNIIRLSNKNKDQLRQILLELTQDEIYRFAGDFIEAAIQLNDEPFLDYINSDESEDGVEDITYWVVSQGKEYYTRVWENPETIPPHIDIDDRQILYGVAEKVYREKFGEEMPDLYDKSGYPIYHL